MNLKLSNMIDMSNGCIVNLEAIMNEVKSYRCTINLSTTYNEDKIKLYFALKPEDFIKFIKKFDLDFCSIAEYKCGYRLMVRMGDGDIEFFTLLHFLSDRYTKDFEAVEHFLRK